MSSFIAVARHETHGRLIAWGGALALGLVPPALPRLVAGTSGSELRFAATAVLALLYVGLVAIIVGGSMLGGELAERRAGFYLSRPLSTAAIFGGKVAALTALLLGSELLLWLPTVIVESARADIASALAILAAATPLFVGVGLAGGVAARCRSPWLLLDLAVAGAGLALLAALGQRLAIEVWLHPGATGRLVAVVGGALGVFACALLAGAAAALARGRTDAGRAHRAMSVVLAATLLPAGGAALAAVRALEHIDIHQLGAVTAASGDGDWIYVSGPVAHEPPRGWEPDFLLQRSTGRACQLGVIGVDVMPAFAPDGARVAWLETENPLVVLMSRVPASETLVVEPPGDAARQRRATVDLDALAIGWSPDGARLALLAEITSSCATPPRCAWSTKRRRRAAPASCARASPAACCAPSPSIVTRSRSSPSAPAHRRRGRGWPPPRPGSTPRRPAIACSSDARTAPSTSCGSTAPRVGWCPAAATRPRSRCRRWSPSPNVAASCPTAGWRSPSAASARPPACASSMPTATRYAPWRSAPAASSSDR